VCRLRIDSIEDLEEVVGRFYGEESGVLIGLLSLRSAVVRVPKWDTV
jgi:hypothetical protein